MEKLYIVIPAYNEEEAITEVVKEWHEVVAKISPESKLLILNDGSKDGTLKVLEQLKLSLPQLEVHDKPNSGHGPSCLLGYKIATEQGASWVFQTDSDGQTLPEEFWPFWEKRNEADFLIGYRPTRGDGAIRWVISRVLKVVILCIFGVYVKDANVPFRLMRVSALQKYLSRIPENFFLANALLPILLVKGREKILWLKIHFRPRTGGVPSVSLKRFFRVGLRVTKDFWNYARTV